MQSLMQFLGHLRINDLSVRRVFVGLAIDYLGADFSFHTDILVEADVLPSMPILMLAVPT
jgi:hypothetical protein